VNTEEVTMLLARIQVLDNRQVDQLTIEAWAPLMADVTYSDAVEAVNRHFQTSTKYLMPAHIRQGIAMREAVATMSEVRGECPPGRHKTLPNGTCMLCTFRPL